MTGPDPARPPAMTGRDEPRVLFVCTGNATRSVLAAKLLQAARPGWQVESAGTLVVEGLPPSGRTRAALSLVGVTDHRHASRQLREDDLERAELVIGFEAYHVDYVRRRHPAASARTGTLRRLARDLPPGPAPLADRVAALRLDAVALEPWEDVVDPGGGDQAAFEACAVDVAGLLRRLLPRLDPP